RAAQSQGRPGPVGTVPAGRPAAPRRASVAAGSMADDADRASVPARLRSARAAALKAGDRPAVRALRSALGAIENAEAVAVRPPPGPARSRIAGAVAGLGAGEIARRDLPAA